MLLVVSCRNIHSVPNYAASRAAGSIHPLMDNRLVLMTATDVNINGVVLSRAKKNVSQTG